MICPRCGSRCLAQSCNTDIGGRLSGGSRLTGLLPGHGDETRGGSPAFHRSLTSLSDRWYEPPEPVICCALAEDEEGHDSEACLADQAEAAAEARAERQREDALEDSFWCKRL